MDEVFNWMRLIPITLTLRKFCLGTGMHLRDYLLVGREVLSMGLRILDLVLTPLSSLHKSAVLLSLGRMLDTFIFFSFLFIIAF